MTRRRGTGTARSMVLLAALLFSADPAWAQTTWYVDDNAPDDPCWGDPNVSDPNEDGSAAHPYDAIQEGINAATGGDEVVVLEGAYTGPGNRDLDYGGKAITVRSADPNDPNVVAATVIDCQADANDPHRGFHFHSGEDANSVVAGLTISNGYAADGGGIYCNLASNPSLVDCVLVSNSADDRGGGMCSDANSTPTITDCAFNGNSAFMGGGLMNIGSSPAVTNSAFIGNAADAGGGAFNETASSPIFTNCTFSGNSTDWGGGMYNRTASSPILTNCTFCGNSSVASGGAMYNDEDSSPILTNCIFSGNSAGFNGGALFNHTQSHPTLTNCTLSNNAAISYLGDGIANYQSNPTVTNCILWDNGSDEISGGEPVVSYSNVQHGWVGTGNISLDPRFVDADGLDNVLGTQDDNLRLLRGSPCIDAGNNDAVPNDVADLDGDEVTDEPTPFDLDGDPRFVDDPNVDPDPGNGTPPIVDMGAYEDAKGEYTLLLSTESVSVSEGQTATFTVALSTDPQETIQATVARQYGDADITVQSGALLTFDSSNYSQPQTVTLAAAEDDDYLDGVATIAVTVPGVVSAAVTATEQDDEEPPAVLYVDLDAPGQNNGVSWTDAFTDLQSALAVLANVAGNVEIRVATGTYKPSAAGDREATFQLIDGVAIYGGYAGWGETDPDERDIVVHGTILSGDLLGNDTGDANDPSRNDNSYHVVTGSGTDGTAVLDGFTVTAGGAYGGPADLHGGGMYTHGGSPTLTNCTFSGNWAAFAGGGMYNIADSCPSMTNCTFSGNAQVEPGGGGGGMANAESSPTLVNCTFSNNSATEIGAGMDNLYSSPMLINCTFTANSTSVRGGGMLNYVSSPTLIGCTFSGNSAAYGGGMRNWIESSPVLNNCTFIGNSASTSGGAIYGDYDSNPTLVNCTLSGNSAAWGGAIINFSGSRPTLTNCILWGNTASSGGPQLCIASGVTTISYSDVQGGPNEIWIDLTATLNWLDGNIDADPLFTPEKHLQNGSPCIDAGNNEADIDANTPGAQPLFPVDGDLHVRRFDDPNTVDTGYPVGGAPIVDMGAYEFGSPLIPAQLFVNDDAAGANLGTSWTDALADLQFALQTVLVAGGRVSELWVASGTYRPASAGGDRTATFRLMNGLDLYGGFAGSETQRDQRDPNFNESVLSGDLDGDDAGDPNDPSRNENSYHVVTARASNATAVLDGFTISGGNANGGSPDDTGAGLYIPSGGPTIRNCQLGGNRSDTQAGGLFSTTAQPTFSNLAVDENTAPIGDGGAIVDNQVVLLGSLGLTTGTLNVTASQFEGPGSIDLAPNATLKITGEPGDAGTIIYTHITGAGDIDIEAGQELAIAGDAVVDLGGGGGCNPDPNDPNAGVITVEGSFLVRDNATVQNTRIDVKLADVDWSHGTVENNIIQLEGSTGFGGEFYVSGNVTVSCNTISSEGDRYLDLDPDPDSPNRPTITNNQITVIIKQGTLGSQGTLLELRARDYDCGGPNNPNGGSGAYQVPPSSPGFTADPSENWVLEELRIDPNAKVNLTNRQGFVYQDPNDPNDETVYVKKLKLCENAVLNTGLQTLYYQMLVDQNDAEIIRDPNQPNGPFTNGSRIIDIPMMGFSLGIIAMEDTTEFDVRVRRRLRDPGDVQPEDPPFKEGAIHRVDDPTHGGLMEMRTQEPGSLSASSVAAAGAFARAAEDEIVVAFDYLFRQNPSGDAYLTVYLCERHDPDANAVAVAHVYPPAYGRRGAVGSDEFAVFHAIMPRGDFNFTRGTYVKIVLHGDDAVCWIDNWDPYIECTDECASMDGLEGVSEADYLLLLVAATGQDLPSMWCADVTGDGYLDITDLLSWDAFFSEALNLCPTPPPPLGGSEAGGKASASFSMGTSFGGPDDVLVIAGKSCDPSDYQYDFLYTLDPNGGLAGQKQAPSCPVPGQCDMGNGRLVTDDAGGVYQLHTVYGLVHREHATAIVGPDHTLTYNEDPNFGDSDVWVGITNQEGLPLTDAVFDRRDDSYVYVVPVVVHRPGGAGNPYKAVAKLEILGDPNDGNYDLVGLYGKDPNDEPNQSIDPLNGTVTLETDVWQVREVDVDGYGNVFVLSAQAWNENDWVLIYDEALGNGSEVRVLLKDVLGTELEAPTALHVSCDDTMLWLASAKNAPDASSTQVYRFTIVRSGTTATGLTDAGSVEITNMRHVTSMTEDPATGTVYVMGVMAPTFDPEAGNPDADTPIFTWPTLAVVPDGEPGPVAATEISSEDPNHDLALPLSAVFVPAGTCYTLTVIFDGSEGTVTAVPDLSCYAPNVPVLLTAEPLGNKQFKKWKVWDAYDANITAIDTNNPITIDMVADRQVKAFFKCGGGMDEALPLLTTGMILTAFASHRLRRRS